MEYLPTKTILKELRYDTSGWFGIDYNMNLYKGCNHGCIYCDSRSERYHVEDFDKVRIKDDCISILERELKRIKTKGVVGIGAMSDCYNPFEREFEITRKSLLILERNGFGVALATKSDLVCRDVDILGRMSKRSNCIVKITITSSDDALSKVIEPNAPESSRRFEALKTLTENDVFAGIILMPVLPHITDSEDNIRDIVRKAHESRARFIIAVFGVTLRDIQRDYFYDRLEESFPGLKERYEKSYGDRYSCSTGNHRKLEKILSEECERYGILHRMEDVIEAYKVFKPPTQTTLF